MAVLLALVWAGPNTDEDQEEDPEGRADLEEQFAAAVRE